MKTYVITLSKTFPKTHKRAGEPTNFRTLFETGVKKHTIRANYPLWKKRMEEVQEGKACLSIRQWSDKPYRSNQIEIARLTADNGVGIQYMYYPELMCVTLDKDRKDITKILSASQLANNDVGIQYMYYPELMCVTLDKDRKDIIKILSASQLANNDGLSFIDWQDWFKDYDLSQPLAIIHFTEFRY